MNVPQEAIDAGARAYCLARYDYSGPYVDAAAWEAAIVADAQSTGGEGWLTRTLEAAAPLIAAAERDRITAGTQTLKEEAGRLALMCDDPLLAVAFSAQQEALAAVLDLIGDGT